MVHVKAKSPVSAPNRSLTGICVTAGRCFAAQAFNAFLTDEKSRIILSRAADSNGASTSGRWLIP